MAFRDGFLGKANNAPSELVPTSVGDVLVKAPLAGRVDFFRKRLVPDGGDMPMTHALLVAMSCYEPETGDPCFGPEDVKELEKVPVSLFTPLREAAERVTKGLTLDPTTPAMQPGSN